MRTGGRERPVGSRWLLDPCRAKRLTTDSRIPNHPLTPSCIQYTHDPNLLGRVGQVRTIFSSFVRFPLTLAVEVLIIKRVGKESSDLGVGENSRQPWTPKTKYPHRNLVSPHNLTPFGDV